MVIFLIACLSHAQYIGEFTNPSREQSGEVDLVARGDRLFMSWIEPLSQHEGTIYVASHKHGRWTPPVEVHHSTRLFINWADTPRIIVTDELMLVAWPEMIGETTYAYGLRYRISTDGGEKWSVPAWLHDDTRPTEHGFVSLAAGDHDTITAVWLDGRFLETKNKMQLVSRQITRSGLGPETVLDDQTCECCKTALVHSENAMIAAYRDLSDTQIRDIGVISHSAQWDVPRVVHPDQWLIHGCPVNGPDLSALGPRVSLAWYTGHPEPRVYVALSTNNGKQFGPRIRLDNGDPVGRITSCYLDGRLLAIWLEQEGERVNLVGRLIEPSGATTPLINIGEMPSGRVSGFPRMASIGARVAIAFQDATKPRIKTVWLSLDQGKTQ